MILNNWYFDSGPKYFFSTSPLSRFRISLNYGSMFLSSLGRGFQGATLSHVWFICLRGYAFPNFSTSLSFHFIISSTFHHCWKLKPTPMSATYFTNIRKYDMHIRLRRIRWDYNLHLRKKWDIPGSWVQLCIFR